MEKKIIGRKWEQNIMKQKEKGLEWDKINLIFLQKKIGFGAKLI